MTIYELAFLKLFFQNLYASHIGRKGPEITTENIVMCAKSSKTTKEMYKLMYRMYRMALHTEQLNPLMSL